MCGNWEGRVEPTFEIAECPLITLWVYSLISSGLVEWAEYLLGVVSEGRRGGRETTHSLVAGVRV